jgi:hypothetical protein
MVMQPPAYSKSCHQAIASRAILSNSKRGIPVLTWAVRGDSDGYFISFSKDSKLGALRTII